MKAINRLFKTSLLGLVVAASASMVSCNDDELGIPSVDTWASVSLSTTYQNPAVAGRTETGSLKYFVSGTTLYYNITVSGLLTGDVLDRAHFHAGDALTNGSIILDFDPIFNGGSEASGSVTISQSLADSLKDATKEIYFNVHSVQHPDGLVRGQLNKTIDLAADLTLSGDNQVPAVTTTATGTAVIRLMTDKTLYSKVSVSNLEVTDELTMAHIHTGAADANGGIIVMLCSSLADFGVAKVTTLDDATMAMVKAQSTYVNVHSVAHPDGVVRAQLTTGGYTSPNPPTNPNPPYTPGY